MVRISVTVTSLIDVLAKYDSLKLYKSATETGEYTEVTSLSTRPVLNVGTTIYFLQDAEGSESFWYKTSYFNSVTEDESSLSTALRGGLQGERFGFSFSNYLSPPGEWGDVLTPDDIRYTYLFGLDLTAQDIAKGVLLDQQISYLVLSALQDIEKYLTLDIRRRKYVYQPSSAKVRSVLWREGVDYTDEEDAYDFDPQLWQQFGFLQLRHFPIIKVTKAYLLSVTHDVVMDLLQQNWVRINKKVGQLNFFPQQGLSYGPFTVMGNIWRVNMGSQYPQGFVCEYETGFESAMFVPADLRDVIGKWCCIKLLAILGDAQYPGITSSSISLDGLSESKSLTKSAQSGLYGARIKQYTDDVANWLQRNRYKYSLPIGFVGAR